MANTFHVSMYVKDLGAALARYRKILGIEPAKVRPGYAKFEIADPPVIFSLVVGGEPGKISHLGIRYPGTGDVATEMARTKREGIDLVQQEGVTCCYAKADKFWVKDEDGMPWEMYALLADVEAETADDPKLRRFLGQGAFAQPAEKAETANEGSCCAPGSACG
jgi:catechol 2,3-dioxygenase-like lactoylglutathione lyase family enzyme